MSQTVNIPRAARMAKIEYATATIRSTAGSPACADGGGGADGGASTLEALGPAWAGWERAASMPLRARGKALRTTSSPRKSMPNVAANVDVAFSGGVSVASAYSLADVAK